MGPDKIYYCKECKKYSTNKELCGHEREFLFSRKQQVKLSKFLSYIFRHNPQQLGIELDENGFSQISVDELIILIKKDARFSWLNRQKLEALVQLDPKGRFEIKNERFRCRYGHSLKNISLNDLYKNVPQILYHGTNLKAYEKIVSDGLKPMGRNLVHLTLSIPDAKMVARRHGGQMVILEIDALQAQKDGIEIFQASPTIFVAKSIPKKYIKRIF